MGITYTNPESELFRPEWATTTAITVMGGTIMFLAVVAFFVVYFSTLFCKRTAEQEVSFPTSEAYHDEKKYGLAKNLGPWIAIAVVQILIAYIPAIREAIEFPAHGAPPYLPGNPMPITGPK